MSYWDGVWKRAASKGIFHAMHSVASKHSEGMLDTRLIPHLAKVETICELGSGSGLNSLYLSRKFPGSTATLIDTSVPVLESARASFSAASVPVVLKNMDMFSLGDHEQYDIVHSGGLLEHFDDAVAVLDLHLRLTKKGGITFISIPKKCWYWDGFIFLVKLFKHEFTDQKNYTAAEFISVVRQAHRKTPCFKVVDFASDGIDITFTARKLA